MSFTLNEALRPRNVVSVLVLSTLGLTACSGSESTVDEQLKQLHKEASDLCIGQATEAVDAKYPKVSIGSEPSLEELEAAVAKAKAREEEGAETYTREYTDCMDKHYFDVVESLQDGSVPVSTVKEPTANTEA